MSSAASRSIMTVRRRRSLDGLLPLTLFSSLGTNGFNSSVENRKKGGGGFNDEERIITGMDFFPFWFFFHYLSLEKVKEINMSGKNTMRLISAFICWRSTAAVGLQKDKKNMCLTLFQWVDSERWWSNSSSTSSSNWGPTEGKLGTGCC